MHIYFCTLAEAVRGAQGLYLSPKAVEPINEPEENLYDPRRKDVADGKDKTLDVKRVYLSPERIPTEIKDAARESTDTSSKVRNKASPDCVRNVPRSVADTVIVSN